MSRDFERGVGIIMEQRMAALNYCYVPEDEVDTIEHLTEVMFAATKAIHELVSTTSKDDYILMDATARLRVEAIVDSVDAIGIGNA
jgi:hypothetical protein